MSKITNKMSSRIGSTMRFKRRTRRHNVGETGQQGEE